MRRCGTEEELESSRGVHRRSKSIRWEPGGRHFGGWDLFIEGAVRTRIPLICQLHEHEQFKSITSHSNSFTHNQSKARKELGTTTVERPGKVLGQCRVIRWS